MDLVLATLNARYVHASFGLRSIYANLQDHVRQRAEIMEFEISDVPVQVVERILLSKPTVVGFGVYIWNARQTLDCMRLIRRIAPEVVLVVGGPEVSYESEKQEFCSLADYIVTGEADLSFSNLSAALLRGERPEHHLVRSPVPAVESLKFPYEFYSDRDLQQRVIYVEASRGCPFSCEFCLSSLEIPVRQFALEPFLAEMARLIERGARQFKFVDRTFNLNLKVSLAILQFFKDRFIPGLFLHFEMIPDRLPVELGELLAWFPPGAVQLEVGIQSFNPTVAKLISRRQDVAKIESNLRYLREHTGVHIHADLIAGLPGEDLASFASGFDRLLDLGPHEIQVGILKRLRGTPIVRHDSEWAMVYSPDPPYEILSNRCLDFITVQRVRRFARYWDLVGNSGNFVLTLPLFWQHGPAFWTFLKFSDWLWQETAERHGFSLHRLTNYVRRFLVTVLGCSESQVDAAIEADYARLGRTQRPDGMLRSVGKQVGQRARRSGPVQAVPLRQARHLAS